MTFVGIIDYNTSVRSNAIRVISGERIISFRGKLLVSGGLAKSTSDVGKYAD
jgi:hypothetical protein